MIAVLKRRMMSVSKRVTSVLGAGGLVLLIVVIVTGIARYSHGGGRGYVYDFSNANHDVVTAVVEDGKVILPGVDGFTTAAFLEVQIQTSGLDRLWSSRVDLKSETHHADHYFERGAGGTRYLNVTAFLSKKPVTIDISTRHVTIGEQSAKLYLLKGKPVTDRRILVIAPHPDDAEIAAFGLYSSSADVHVVTVTAGDAGAFKYDEVYTDKVSHYLNKGRLRTWDSITVPLLGGVPPEKAINLGFFDATLQQMYCRPGQVVPGRYTQVSDIETFRHMNVSSLSEGLQGQSDWSSLVSNMRYLLTAIRPDVIITPYPALDRHPDHKLTSIALFEAIRKSGIRGSRLLLYTNHFVGDENFPYGEQGAVVTLPPDIQGGKLFFDTIYSHPLSRDRQLEKMMALESMHDLRMDTEWRNFVGIVKMGVIKVISYMRFGDISYYRRAVRDNELFFGINADDLDISDVSDRVVGTLPACD